jgi:alkaline phosphatase D
MVAMADGMKRREFLRLTGTFFAAASLGGIPGCGGDDGGGTDAGPDGPQTGLVLFPQGLASGDPRETSVVLWTRAVKAAGGTDNVDLTLEVASDPAFTTIVAMQSVTAMSSVDNTVRVIVTGLAADTIYYYRFKNGADVISGRTRTAPAANSDVPIRLAWTSCQDYGAGHFGAYKVMLQEDMARAEADQIRFVLHLGDFIYETRGDRFQVPLDDNLQPVTLNNPDGSPRQVGPFPSGGGSAGGVNFAQTVDDFRHLYKTFASDPDLMAARARWPFVHTWDDHEFSNDCWQSQANYTNANSTDEPSQRKRVAANQAWFEYIPAQLTGSTGVTGVEQRARDFMAATVTDAAFTTANSDNFVDEPNNVAAVGSITIYRSLRFGRHVELVITDERSYRSDHAIPEEFAEMSLEYLDHRNVLPRDDLDVMDAGRTYNNNNPPATVGFNGFANPRISSPPGTMLGTQQKQWWKDTMRGSNATWKVWANQVPLMRFEIKKGPVNGLIVDRIMDGDAWDGYAVERNELMTYLRDQNVDNLLVLTGDIHAQFAGIVHHNFTAASPTPVGVEFCAAGIASNSVFSFFEDASRPPAAPPDVRGLVTYDASSMGGPAFVENMNMLLLHGTAAAYTMYQTNNRTMALAQSDPTNNPHLKYADCNAQGFGVALVTATQVDATLTTISRPVTMAAATVRRTARFVVPLDNPAGMTGPTFTGTPPFPFV